MYQKKKKTNLLIISKLVYKIEKSNSFRCLHSYSQVLLAMKSDVDCGDHMNEIIEI